MSTKTLQAFVDQENQWSSMFNKNYQPLSLTNAQDRQRIASIIDSKLSPENLSCDGELPRAEVNRRYRQLSRCAKELLSIDPSVQIWEY
jgi:hypothetical protein